MTLASSDSARARERPLDTSMCPARGAEPEFGGVTSWRHGGLSERIRDNRASGQVWGDHGGRVSRLPEGRRRPRASRAARRRALVIAGMSRDALRHGRRADGRLDPEIR